jgi:hypothetical protein
MSHNKWEVNMTNKSENIKSEDIETDASKNIVVPRLGFTLEELGEAACPKKKLSRATMYREVQDGHLEVTKIRKRLIVTNEQADAWLKRRARTTLEEPAHLAKARRKKQANDS